MAKSNAQRQREWRERQKAKRICTYGGCGNSVEPPNTLCDEHRAQAREARRGSVRQLNAQVEDLKMENARLQGQLAELRARYAEVSEYRCLQAEHKMLLDSYGDLAIIVVKAYNVGLISKDSVPTDVFEQGVKAGLIQRSEPELEPDGLDTMATGK